MRGVQRDGADCRPVSPFTPVIDVTVAVVRAAVICHVCTRDYDRSVSLVHHLPPDNEPLLSWKAPVWT